MSINADLADINAKNRPGADPSRYRPPVGWADPVDRAGHLTGGPDRVDHGGDHADASPSSRSFRDVAQQSTHDFAATESCSSGHYVTSRGRAMGEIVEPISGNSSAVRSWGRAARSTTNPHRWPGSWSRL